MIDVFKRYQSGLRLADLYPLRNDEKCACGCGNDLPPKKRRWASTDCQEKAVINFFIIKGDNYVIRDNILKRDKGYCSCCGVYSANWQADHIIPVFLGGSACGLDNFQTLCEDCHKEKTYNDFHIASITLHASCIFDLRLITEVGAISCVFPKQSIEMDSLVSAFG